MGIAHAQTATECGFNIRIGTDPVRARARALAKQFGATSVADASDAIFDDSIDAVIVSTPTSHHHPYVIDALDSGKAVFCETPLASDSAQCLEITKVAKRTKGKLFVAHPFRYSRPWAAIKPQLSAGALGDVGSVRSFRGWARPKGAHHWYRDASGGPIFDVLTHDFDWLCATFGSPSTIFCQSVQACGAKSVDHVMATIVFESGVIAQCIGSWAYTQAQCRIEICGTDGVVSFDSLEGPSTPRSLDTGAHESQATVDDDSRRGQWMAFKSWIEGGTDLSSSAYDAWLAVLLAESAVKSTHTGRQINLSKICEGIVV